MAVARAHLWISGRVQGVFYRATAYQEAVGRKLCGWVRNLPDGRVEMVMEGEQNQIEEMIRWCYKGPPSARVSRIDALWNEPVENLKTFEITH